MAEEPIQNRGGRGSVVREMLEHQEDRLVELPEGEFVSLFVVLALNGCREARRGDVDILDRALDCDLGAVTCRQDLREVPEKLVEVPLDRIFRGSPQRVPPFP